MPTYEIDVSECPCCADTVDCAECPGSMVAPAELRVLTALTDASCSDCDQFTDVVCTYSGSCRWDSADTICAVDNITINVAVGIMVLDFGGHITYSATIEDCMASNILNRSGSSSVCNFPATLIVEPA